MCAATQAIRRQRESPGAGAVGRSVVPSVAGVCSPEPGVSELGNPLNGAPRSDPSGRPTRSAGGPIERSSPGTGAGVNTPLGAVCATTRAMGAAARRAARNQRMIIPNVEGPAGLPPAQGKPYRATPPRLATPPRPEIAMRRLAPALALSALLLAPPLQAGAKTLTWSFSSDILTLDPHTSRVTFTNAFLANIYETLVRFDDKLALQPALATSWERVSPTLWRFRLREGVRFQEGQTFTADDVLFTWARLNTPGANRGPLSAVTAMRAPDPLTLEIETAKPFPVLLNALVGMGIMSRAWAEANGAQNASDLAAKTENHATRHANGTGPFRLASRQPDGPTVLEANPTWWDTRRHDLDSVTFLPIRNAATRTASLISGSTDATVDLPLQDVDRVSRDPKLQVVQGPELRTIYIGLDQFRDELLYSDVKGRNPLRDRRVREALYRAIDEAAIKRSVMRDQAWPAGFMASPQLPGAPQDLNERLPFDPEASKRLLAEAGYKDGFQLGLTCPNDRYVNDERICQAIAAMWTRIGVRTAVQSETSVVWSRRTANGDVSAFMLGHAALPLAEVYSTLSEVIHSRSDVAGGLNYGRYSNPAVDKLIDQAGEETDDTRRAAAVREAFRLEKEDIGNIPLHQQPLVWASRRGIDLHQAPDNYFRLWLVKVD